MSNRSRQRGISMTVIAFTRDRIHLHASSYKHTDLQMKITDFSVSQRISLAYFPYESVQVVYKHICSSQRLFSLLKKKKFLKSTVVFFEIFLLQPETFISEYTLGKREYIRWCPNRIFVLLDRKTHHIYFSSLLELWIKMFPTFV